MKMPFRRVASLFARDVLIVSEVTARFILIILALKIHGRNISPQARMKRATEKQARTDGASLHTAHE